MPTCMLHAKPLLFPSHFLSHASAAPLHTTTGLQLSQSFKEQHCYHHSALINSLHTSRSPHPFTSPLPKKPLPRHAPPHGPSTLLPTRNTHTPLAPHPGPRSKEPSSPPQTSLHTAHPRCYPHAPYAPVASHLAPCTHKTLATSCPNSRLIHTATYTHHTHLRPYIQRRGPCLCQYGS